MLTSAVLVSEGDERVRSEDVEAVRCRVNSMGLSSCVNIEL